MSNTIDVQRQPQQQSVVRAVPKRKRDYIYHVRTRNISFIQTASDLKSLGIKNYMFHLKLYDRSLEFVDPHSPLLLEEQKIAVMNECLRNPWYFLRECVRIPDQGGTGIPYQLHRANLASTFCFLMGIDHYLVIPRQTGKTMSTMAILAWAFLFGTTSSEFMFINKQLKDATNNLQRLKEIREALPSYMRMEQIVTESGKVDKGLTNITAISNPVTKNKIVTKPSASSVEKANGLGRGCTQPIQYYDEVEFTPFIRTIAMAAGPAFNTASENAKRNNSAYCRIFTSTPGDLDTQPGQDAIKIIEETCTWSEQFYDWPKQKINEYVEKNSGNKIVYIMYDYKQIGKDEAWFQKICQLVFNDPVSIKREIFLQRMRGSSDSPFEIEELSMIEEKMKAPIESIFLNGLYKLDIYQELERTIPYIVSCDCAQGLGQDNSALTIINPYNLLPVAEFKSPYISTFAYAKLLRTLVRKYVPHAILAIERNNVGTAIIDQLRETEISSRIYFDDSLDKNIVVDKLDQQGFLKHEASRRRMYGVWTGKTSRDMMMGLLEGHVKEHKDKFVTQNITNDLLGLVRTRTGKIEHAKGFHDDSIMSYLIGLYVWYYGKNLARFGFEKGVLPGEEEQNKGFTAQEVLDTMPEEVQEQFKHTIEEQTMENYHEKMKAEIEQNRRALSSFNDMVGATHGASVTDVDSYEYDSFDEDMFDELNI